MRAKVPGIRVQVVADDAEQRQTVLGDDVGEVREVLHDRLEAPHVVDGDRDAHFRRGHDVDGRLVPLEHLEEAAQEPVRFEHAARRSRR